MDTVAQHPPPVAVARKHVLVLNSNPDLLDLVRQVLEHVSSHATTSVVPCSFEQIAVLEPDSLIFDLAIYQQAGWDLLERLAQAALTQDMPVIGTSTDQALLDRAEGKKARYGGHSWIVKPFHLNNLLVEIDRLIGPA